MNISFKAFLFLVFLFVFLLLNKGNNLSFLDHQDKESVEEDYVEKDYDEEADLSADKSDLEDLEETKTFEPGMELLPKSDGVHFKFVDQESGNTVISIRPGNSF